MIITLIEQGESILNRKTNKEILTGTGITQLSDCSMVLLHKVGLRPLYISNDEGEHLEYCPKIKLSPPSVILFTDGSPGQHSAQIIQEQLKNGGISTNIAKLDTIDSNADLEIYAHMLKKHMEFLETKGHNHIVITATQKKLEKVAQSIAHQTLAKEVSLPIYSFENGKEIKDPNLINGLYVTRDLLDTMLLHRLNKDSEKKFRPVLEDYILKNKLHLYE